MKKLKCPKCKKTSGDDWSQCGKNCPMPMSPHYKDPNQVLVQQERGVSKKEHAPEQAKGVAKKSKPKQSEDTYFDIFFDHFAEPTDKPNITVYVGDNCYEATSPYDRADQIKEMRRHAQWLLKAADWLEYKNR